MVGGIGYEVFFVFRCCFYLFLFLIFLYLFLFIFLFIFIHFFFFFRGGILTRVLHVSTEVEMGLCPIAHLLMAMSGKRYKHSLLLLFFIIIFKNRIQSFHLLHFLSLLLPFTFSLYLPSPLLSLSHPPFSRNVTVQGVNLNTKDLKLKMLNIEKYWIMIPFFRPFWSLFVRRRRDKREKVLE